MTSWLTLPEYLAASGMSRRTFFRRRNEIDAKTIDGVVKYSAASLSIEARAKLKSLGEPVATSNSAAHGPLFARVSPAPQALRSQRVTLTPEAQRDAEARLEILRPLLDFINDPPNRGRFARLTLADGRPVTSSDLMAAYLSEAHTDGGKKISTRTLWRWKKAFAEQGIAGLARNVRSDKGQSRWFAQHGPAAKLVASVYLKPYQTVQTAYNALLRDAEMLGLDQEDLPSYETVRSYLETIPKPIQVLAREGERVHNERMSLYLQRDYSQLVPNQILVSDHMIHDCEVRNDCFHGIEPNAPMRLRFTCLMDMASRKIVGYSWTPEGNSRSISTALRRAVERYGPCEIFYCDNGKDYQKVARGAEAAAGDSERTLADRRSGWFREDIDAIEKMGVLQRLGMKVQFCIKYHPQSKPIERLFRTMHLQLDAKMPHYTTGNAYLKPDYTVIAMVEHRKLLRMDRGHESPLVPASHFIRMATVWIEEEYNAKHSHSGKGMNGRTPNEVFDAGYPAAARRTVDPDVLAQLLWSREKRRVRECAVTLSGRRYMASSPADSAAMYLRNEQDVLICFDPHDMDRAIVADLDGHKIAQVQVERLMSHSAADTPAIAASMQERRRLRNATANTVRNLRGDVAAAGHRSDVEILHERALLPAAVGDFITQRHPQTVESTTAQTHHLHSEDIGDRLADSLLRRTANGTLG